MKKQTSERIDCLGLGIMPLDLLFSVDVFPKPGSKIDSDNMVAQGGGPVPNVMVGLSRLGHSAVLISAVGNDPTGLMGIASLQKENVDCQFLVRKKGNSDSAFGLIENETGRRTIVLSRELGVKTSDIAPNRYPIPQIIHLDGRDMSATMKLARWGKKVGATVTFDIGSMRNDVSKVFPLVDHLVVADTYALPFTGCQKAKQAISTLQKLCHGTIVITEGINGALGIENRSTVWQPAYKVNVVDSTGAGDAFHTGYIHGLLANFSFDERLRLGAVAAAIKCRMAGARAGLPTRYAIRNFLKNNPESYDSIPH